MNYAESMPLPIHDRISPLSRNAVVEAALRLTREHGIDGVTMRSLATELGVTPMAIYHHVRDKDELVGLIAEAAGCEALPLELGDRAWEEVLREYLMSRWTSLQDYPGLGACVVSMPSLGTDPDTYARGVEFFEKAGFSPRVARLAWPYAVTYVHGRLSVEANLDRETARSTGLSEIPAKEHVAFGVDAVVAGLQSILERETRLNEAEHRA